VCVVSRTINVTRKNTARHSISSRLRLNLASENAVKLISGHSTATIELCSATKKRPTTYNPSVYIKEVIWPFVLGAEGSWGHHGVSHM